MARRLPIYGDTLSSRPLRASRSIQARVGWWSPSLTLRARNELAMKSLRTAHGVCLLLCCVLIRRVHDRVR